MATCPTCGQKLPPPLLDAETLHEVLLNGKPQREVYATDDGEWFVTYGGGQASPSAVAQLIKQQLIFSKYNTIPDLVYYIGPTIDIPATTEARKKFGKKAGLVYVPSPSRPQEG